MSAASASEAEAPTVSVIFPVFNRLKYLQPAIESVINGKVTCEPENARPRRLWLKVVIVVVLLASGTHLAPITVPIFSPVRFLA